MEWLPAPPRPCHHHRFPIRLVRRPPPSGTPPSIEQISQPQTTLMNWRWGMVTIQNLALLRQRGQGYLVGLKRRRNEQVDRYIQAAAQGPWQECPVGITALEREKVPRTMVTEVAGEEPGVRVFVVQSEERR